MDFGLFHVPCDASESGHVRVVLMPPLGDFRRRMVDIHIARRNTSACGRMASYRTRNGGVSDDETWTVIDTEEASRL